MWSDYTVMAQTGPFHRIYFGMILSEVFYDIPTGLCASYGTGEACVSGLVPGYTIYRAGSRFPSMDGWINQSGLPRPM